MQKEYLLMFPIGILILIAILSMMGLGATTADFSTGFRRYDSATSTDSDGNLLYLYHNGEALCYWNGTGVNPDNGGVFKNDYTAGANWRNSTGSYALYYDIDNTKPVKWADVKGSIPFITQSSIDDVEGFSFTDSLSWIVVIVVIMGIGSIVGIKIFGSGESEVSVELLLKGTFFITIWGILTALAYPLILEAGFYIYILYFVIALLYTVGVILNIKP